MSVSAFAGSAVPGPARITVGTLPYRELNRRLKAMVDAGVEQIELRGVFGQRYIGTNLRAPVRLTVYGTPGNDLGAFMDGPSIEVFGNAQDGLGNTMNSGRIVVHGDAGDLLGMSMRGGEIYVRGNVGYRCAIHMKEYEDMRPTVVVGGTAADFFGEYMAGGRVVLLGLHLPPGAAHPGSFMGTGMHGGVIYVRGRVDRARLGTGVAVREMTDEDWPFVRQCVHEYVRLFGCGTAGAPGAAAGRRGTAAGEAGSPAPSGKKILSAEEILNSPFVVLCPQALRPFAALYAART